MDQQTARDIVSAARTRLWVIRHHAKQAAHRARYRRHMAALKHTTAEALVYLAKKAHRV
jgi:hypothetical protein